MDKGQYSYNRKMRRSRIPELIIFILQASVDKSIDETPSQQEDKMERNVSKNNNTCFTFEL